MVGNNWTAHRYIPQDSLWCLNRLILYGKPHFFNLPLNLGLEGISAVLSINYTWNQTSSGLQELIGVFSTELEISQGKSRLKIRIS